jgi:hypothetical protein
VHWFFTAQLDSKPKNWSNGKLKKWLSCGPLKPIRQGRMDAMKRT